MKKVKSLFKIDATKKPSQIKKLRDCVNDTISNKMFEKFILNDDEFYTCLMKSMFQKKENIKKVIDLIVSQSKNKCIVNHFKESPSKKDHRIQLYIKTIAFLSAYNQDLLKEVIDLMHSQYEKNKNTKIYWVFLLLSFNFKHYENVIKILERVEFEKK